MQILGTLLGGAISGAFGGQQQQQPGLTPDEMANLQFAAQSEQNKLINFYSDAGIPFSSGLAFDLGSIPFQTAAAAGQLESSQSPQSLGGITPNNAAQQFAQLGTTLGSQNAGNQNTNPDSSAFTNPGGNSAVPFTSSTSPLGAGT